MRVAVVATKSMFPADIDIISLKKSLIVSLNQLLVLWINLQPPDLIDLTESEIVHRDTVRATKVVNDAFRATHSGVTYERQEPREHWNRLPNKAKWKSLSLSALLAHCVLVGSGYWRQIHVV